MTTVKRVRNKFNGRDIGTLVQVINDSLARVSLASKLGYQYGGKRKLYQALGYPTEQDLTYDWYFERYDRQDIANAIIDRPADATWSGSLVVVEEGKPDSEFSKKWLALNNRLKIKQKLCKVDKLAHIGRFALLLFGFDDVKKNEDFKRPLTGKRNMLYLKQIAENQVTITEFETDTTNERYGQPKYYQIKVGPTSQSTTQSQAEPPIPTIIVHHSRVLHIVSNNLTSEIYGTPKMKPIANRLVDLEKILGGDAEMFWRGARPGYHASARDDYEMGTEELAKLQEQLDNYEHDLRRFINAKGVDIKALEQQLSDPLNHIDAQVQAISAQTGIPKRILIGSERGELSSGQDSDQWLSIIRTRMEEFAEIVMLRPFIEKCMAVGVLPKVAEYSVMWEDVFAPSEAKKVEIGSKRSNALKIYSESPFASDLLPPQLAFKYLLGLNEEQIQEAMNAMVKQMDDEDSLGARVHELDKASRKSAPGEQEQEEDVEQEE